MSIYEDYDVSHLNQVDERLKSVSEMTASERQFLNGLIRYYKPRKLLEVGVAAGASSAVMLNAITDDPEAVLYSLDYSDAYYRDNQKKSGFIVEEMFPELMGKWQLRTGSIAAQFMDEIGDGIDFCLLDTVHSNPGEFLDFLMVLPYLKKNAIIVLHDVSLQVWTEEDWFVTCCTLISVLRGKRFVPTMTEYKYFPNIGAVKLADDVMNDAWPYFNLLTLPWGWERWDYLKENEWEYLSQFVKRHYPEEMVQLFGKVVAYKNDRKLKKEKERELIQQEALKEQAVNQREASIEQAKDYRLEDKPEQKSINARTILKFIKSYFLFPWYVYKTYKMVECLKR